MNLHSIPNGELRTLLIVESCLAAVDTVNSLQASTDEQDIRLPITARGKLWPWELILWEELHSSSIQCICSVDQHLSRFSSTCKVLEPLETYVCLCRVLPSSVPNFDIAHILWWNLNNIMANKFQCIVFLLAFWVVFQMDSNEGELGCQNLLQLKV